FSLPGGLVGRYPSVLALPLAIVALLLTIGACIHQKRSAKDGLPWSGVGHDAVVFSLAAVFALLGGAAASAAMWFGLAEMDSLLQPTVYRDVPWRIFILCLGLSAGVRMLPDGPWRQRVCGAAVVWSVLGVACAATLPGASYLLLWPLLAVSGALVVERRALGPGLLLIAGAPAFLLLGPVSILLFDVMGVISAPLGGVLLTLALGLVSPFDAKTHRGGAMALLMIGLLAGGVGMVRSGFDRQHPQQDVLMYWNDLDVGEGMWMTTKPSLWMRPLLEGDPQPTPQHPLLWGALQGFIVSPLEAPEILWASGSTPAEDGRRAVTARLQVEAAQHVQIDAQRLVSLTFNDRPVNLYGSQSVGIFADLSGGVEMTAVVEGDAPAPVTVTITQLGLPASVARPANTIPRPWAFSASDLTMTRKTLRW
ncbi:MAG: hypothetical protein AAFV53_14195, partial [Myxococcota bacterium]